MYYSIWDILDKQIRKSVRIRLYDSVEGSLWESVMHSVEGSVCSSVYNSLRINIDKI